MGRRGLEKPSRSGISISKGRPLALNGNWSPWFHLHGQVMKGEKLETRIFCSLQTTERRAVNYMKVELKRCLTLQSLHLIEVMIFLQHLFSSHLHAALIMKDIMSAYIYWAHISGFPSLQRYQFSLHCFGSQVIGEGLCTLWAKLTSFKNYFFR